jgi:hypothetical protein
MAGRTGLEPATSCVTGRRSNQLNYRPRFYMKPTAVKEHTTTWIFLASFTMSY